MLGSPACRRTRCVHFVHCAQTAAASQITKHACPSGRRAAGCAALLGAARGEWVGPLLRSAAKNPNSPNPKHKYAPWRVLAQSPLGVPRSAASGGSRSGDPLTSQSEIMRIPRRAARAAGAGPPQGGRASPSGGGELHAAKLRGNLRCSLFAGSRSNSPSAQTIASPDPRKAALLGAARGEWLGPSLRSAG